MLVLFSSPIISISASKSSPCIALVLSTGRNHRRHLSPKISYQPLLQDCYLKMFFSERGPASSVDQLLHIKKVCKRRSIASEALMAKEATIVPENSSLAFLEDVEIKDPIVNNPVKA